jgi:hypothetical protein
VASADYSISETRNILEKAMANFTGDFSNTVFTYFQGILIECTF